MTQYKVDLPPPAKRLVLFVGDGLRSDKLYQLYPIENDDHPVSTVMESKAPYLRNIILNEGVWGISHTRVPTESRPGHVAIIAGFYEDVSAVTKGWKTNPVEFDSAFNQSRHTWSFGSPDILPMFAEGASDPNRIDTFMYEHEDENFAQDIWVFNQFAQLLANSTSDPKLHKQLHENQIIIFLHLLGLDTNGHAHGPHSKEYINNIKLVDEGIKNVVKLIDNYYNHDGGTAYIFTADHGMSNRGNHGDGHPDNTRTPIIAWGAGINKPVKVEVKGEEKEEENLVLVKSDHDEFSYPWNLNHVKRYDVLQADLAPLMIAFFGTGNVASLSSFSLSSVYRLTTIFDPFLMGALLLLKILIPFFIVSSVFSVINKSLNLPAFSLFLLVLSTCDIMTLNFFYLVKDYGSWLEIGTTISHFVISNLFSLFMIILFGLSEILVGKVRIDHSDVDDIVDDLVDLASRRKKDK
ncbi:3923_t:CDS:2 [Entrophospora sp. SA101]|nr:9364_t:CDS:2 [Entrophospora sp. SA101]CAJ0841146.1 3923_t:CDS:2 [Entrophospora sp. SA101]CAJ0921979.1 17894_t:CDS:2 [Entrophospora sp. SA101]